MAKRTREPITAKRIVYLWGAGATQAEISYAGAKTVNLLMRDNDLGEGLATRIISKLPERSKHAFATDQGTDIEKLISLLLASNVDKYQKLATKIRQLYFEDIRDSLEATGVIERPKLATALFMLHRNESFLQHETLSGMVTTNHDGLLQRAASEVHRALNLGIPFASDHFEVGFSGAPMLHLHGSFTWTFGTPIAVSRLSRTSRYAPDMVWIPPTILKETKAYPFNKLAGLAYELLSTRISQG